MGPYSVAHPQYLLSPEYPPPRGAAEPRRCSVFTSPMCYASVDFIDSGVPGVFLLLM